MDRSRYKYPEFLKYELIPALEQLFERNLHAGNLGIMGVSMGGLFGLVMALENPSLFGFSVGLSTHWTGISVFDYLLLPFRNEVGPSESTAKALIKYLKVLSENAKDLDIYIDHGDLGLDRHYNKYAQKMQQILASRAARLCILKFPNEGHQPSYWKHRIGPVFSWLTSGGLTCGSSKESKSHGEHEKAAPLYRQIGS